MNRFVKRARALVGCPFRPQGRSAELGLDCVGLACAVFRIPTAEIPGDYRLRDGNSDRFRDHADRYFRTIAHAKRKPGDLMLLRVAADQLHLAILSDRGFIHAGAGLRKIVETPGAPPWPILSMHRRRKQIVK